MFLLINTTTDPFLPTGKGMVASVFHGLKPDQKPCHFHSQLLALSHLIQTLVSEESMTFCSRNDSLHIGVFYETSLPHWRLAYITILQGQLLTRLPGGLSLALGHALTLV